MNANPRRRVGSVLFLQAHQPLEVVLQVRGAAELIETEITAVADGPLPSDDVTALVTIG